MAQKKPPDNQGDFFTQLFNEKFEGFKGGDKKSTPIETKPTPPDMSRWEKFYTEKWIDALVHALEDPVRVGPTSIDAVKRMNYHGDVILERLINLMKIGRQHDEKFKEMGDNDETYRILAHDWKEPAERLTNWETCFLMMDVSLCQPLPRYAYEEYKRAFAHCFPMKVFMQCFHSTGAHYIEGRIIENECEACRWAVGYGKLQLLDDLEKEWIMDFNFRLQKEIEEQELANSLFSTNVKVVEITP